MDYRPDGKMALFIGKTRSGKSQPIFSAIAHVKRLIVWDMKDEYGIRFNMIIVRDIKKLCTLLAQSKGNARIAFVPSGDAKKEFDIFCRLVMVWNKQKMCTAVVEELAAVTHAGKASGYWNYLVNQSLGYGLTLFATVQRGQEVDKTIFNAATVIYITWHSLEDDAIYIAKKTGLPIKDIPREKLKFVLWSSDHGLLAKGKVTFSKKPVNYFPTGKPAFKSLDGRKSYKPLANATFSNIAA